MKKNLAILSNSLAGGGAERVISILLNEIQDVFDITLVLMENKIEYEIPNGVKVYFLSESSPHESGLLKFLRLPYLGWKYKKFCQKESIDVSLAFMNRASYVSVVAKQLGSQTRTLISERSTPSQLYHQKNLTSFMNKGLIRILYPLADSIITNSKGNARDLVKYFFINPKKITTLYNPFDINKIEEHTFETVKNIDFKKFTFITVGRLDEGKNHQMLIEAFYHLELKDAQLLILGEGPLYLQLNEQIQRYYLQKEVFLLGFDKNPYKYLAKSDVFLFASRYEGFPNVLVEAMICGLAIISTDCSNGPREILSSEDTEDIIEKEEAEYGVLVEVDNVEQMMCAMERMYIDKAYRVSFRDKSKERISSFQMDKVVASWIFEINREIH